MGSQIRKARFTVKETLVRTTADFSVATMEARHRGKYYPPGWSVVCNERTLQLLSGEWSAGARAEAEKPARS